MSNIITFSMTGFDALWHTWTVSLESNKGVEYASLIKYLDHWSQNKLEFFTRSSPFLFKLLPATYQHLATSSLFTWRYRHKRQATRRTQSYQEWVIRQTALRFVVSHTTRLTALFMSIFVFASQVFSPHSCTTSQSSPSNRDLILQRRHLSFHPWRIKPNNKRAQGWNQIQTWHLLSGSGYSGLERKRLATLPLGRGYLPPGRPEPILNAPTCGNRRALMRTKEGRRRRRRKERRGREVEGREAGVRRLRDETDTGGVPGSRRRRHSAHLQ